MRVEWDLWIVCLWVPCGLVFSFLNGAAEPEDAPGQATVKPGLAGAGGCPAMEDNSPHIAEPPMGRERAFGGVP